MSLFGGGQSPNRVAGGGLFAQQEQYPSGGGLFGGPPIPGCLLHRNKPLELFCKTEKIKICVNCAYSKDHEGHDIGLIENMRPDMFDKGTLYEKSLRKVQESKSRIHCTIIQKAKPFDQILKERQRNEEITRLKAWFLIQHYIDSQKVNFQKTLEKKSFSEKELRATAEDYKKGNDSGLVKTVTETLEEIKVKFDESVFEGLSVESKEAIQEQTENLKNELNEIYNQEGGDVLKLKSHFLVKKGQNHLELETRFQTESFELKLSELKEVSSLSIICEKAWFYEEELNLLKLVLLNLPSLDSLSLNCKDDASPQIRGLINGCSIFIHLLQSFQLAINLPLDKLKSFAFVSESKTIEEHNQISHFIRSLISNMSSLKSLKINLNHLFEDSIQKEWDELKKLKLSRDSKEPKDLRRLRELVEQDDLKDANEKIEQKEFEVSRKLKSNCTFRILDILENNQNLENIEFIMPNVEINEHDLRNLRQYRVKEMSLKKWLIKIKTFDSSIPDELQEFIRTGGIIGQSRTQQPNNSGAGVTGGGLFGTKTAPPTEYTGGVGGLFGNKPPQKTGHPGGNQQGEKKKFHFID